MKLQSHSKVDNGHYSCTCMCNLTTDCVHTMCIAGISHGANVRVFRDYRENKNHENFDATALISTSEISRYTHGMYTICCQVARVCTACTNYQ